MYLIMKMLDFSQMKPISSLPRNYSELAESTRETGDLIFLKRNAPYVVLLDFKRWQKLTDLEQKSDEMKALADIRQSETEFEAGEAKTLHSLADL
jgi:PHD/YefM family antitoxin component YafN of YafNO toxin-antitoxin module